ncbi:hypothetical protein [Helicobacter sp. MIT 01-3238]|uniref:hypothetical protein n=1 Tax=Helicobacter sp. MIT 01-3238 TaxID=398627 RepID=UPI0015F14F72|nr:hypothetical protein [Helicobacter sp. MIT 01-3238]
MDKTKVHYSKILPQNLYVLLVVEGDFGNGILSISNDFTQVLADFGVALNSFT